MKQASLRRASPAINLLNGKSVLSLFSLTGSRKRYQSVKRSRLLDCSATSATASTSTTRRTAPRRRRAPTPYLTPPTTATRPTSGPTATSARSSATPPSRVTTTRLSEALRRRRPPAPSPDAFLSLLLQ